MVPSYQVVADLSYLWVVVVLEVQVLVDLLVDLPCLVEEVLSSLGVGVFHQGKVVVSFLVVVDRSIQEVEGVSSLVEEGVGVLLVLGMVVAAGYSILEVEVLDILGVLVVSNVEGVEHVIPVLLLYLALMMVEGVSALEDA